MADKKCPPCPPVGAPAWMATFSDLVTLLLTFFVLLLSFAKTESAKYEAALGSVRDAFGGNVLKQGEVMQLGKSPDDSASMMDSSEPARPFPIEFLTMEGILDKNEINRESTETLKDMKSGLADAELSEFVDLYEVNEGIKVQFKDKIYFSPGSIKIDAVNIEVFDKLIKLMNSKNWVLFVIGHAAKGETSADGAKDAMALSSLRAEAVARSLMKRGVNSSKITVVFYGDSQPDEKTASVAEDRLNRRVEFILRKVGIRDEGHKVDAQ